MKSHYVWSLIGLMTLTCAVWAKDDGNKALKPKRTPEERFSKIDKDKDGQLSLEEYAGRRMRKANKKGATEEELAKLEKKMGRRFKKQDADGNGSVSLEEYVAAAEKMAERKAAKKQKGGGDDD